MRALAALFVCVLLPSAAFAQRRVESETGTNIPIPERARISHRSGLSDVDRGRLAMAAFARCTVDRRSGRVARLLSLKAEDVDGHGLGTLADDECLASGQMRFKPMLLRGALFVELVRRRDGSPGKATGWRLPITPYQRSSAPLALDDERGPELAMLAFANCVIQRDRAGAAAVVLAPTVSAAQDAAFAALAPSLGPCLENGQKIVLGKMILEGALAEVLYRGTVFGAESGREPR